MPLQWRNQIWQSLEEGDGGSVGQSVGGSQTPNSGLRHTSFRRQVPESGVRSVGGSVSTGVVTSVLLWLT